MEQIKKLCREQPLICIICILALISCFAILSATPMISNKVGLRGGRNWIGNAGRAENFRRLPISPRRTYGIFPLL